jgi:hypothetical protein
MKDLMIIDRKGFKIRKDNGKFIPPIADRIINLERKNGANAKWAYYRCIEAWQSIEK